MMPCQLIDEYDYLHCITTERIAHITASSDNHCRPSHGHLRKTPPHPQPNFATETTAAKKVAAVGDVHTSIR